MKSIGEALRDVLGSIQTAEPFVWRCKACGEAREPGRASDGAPRDVCADCWERTTADLLADLERRPDAYIATGLRTLGLRDREREARFDRVTAALASGIRKRAPGALEELLDGRTPRSGFGLSAPAGAGKTLAIAAIIGRAMLAKWRREVPEHGARAFGNFKASWVRWPELSSSWRGRAVEDRNGVDREVVRLRESELLILDDIGAERMAAGYESDWTASLLDLVVDGRQALRRPTLYTTNLDVGGLVSRYGSRFVSRLVSDSPLIVAPNLPDRRLVASS